jgi:hypothetical protein
MRRALRPHLPTSFGNSPDQDRRFPSRISPWSCILGVERRFGERAGAAEASFAPAAGRSLKKSAREPRLGNGAESFRHHNVLKLAFLGPARPNGGEAPRRQNEPRRFHPVKTPAAWPRPRRPTETDGMGIFERPYSASAAAGCLYFAAQSTPCQVVIETGLMKKSQRGSCEAASR